MKVLDLRGEECPTPITKVVRAFAEIGVGEELVAILTSRECAEALKTLFEGSSVAGIELTEEGGTIRLRIKKLSGSEAPKPSDVTC